MATAKSHKWRSSKDAHVCIGCQEPFKRGDDVFNHGCVTMHFRKECVDRYRKDCRELGIEP